MAVTCGQRVASGGTMEEPNWAAMEKALAEATDSKRRKRIKKDIATKKWSWYLELRRREKVQEALARGGTTRWSDPPPA